MELLDVGIRIDDGKLVFFSFYRKEIKSDVMVNSKSAIPTTAKIQTIRNEVKRIRDRSSTKVEEDLALSKLTARLGKNGFNVFNDSSYLSRVKKPRHKATLPPFDGPVFNLPLPFFNDATNNRLS